MVVAGAVFSFLQMTAAGVLHCGGMMVNCWTARLNCAHFLPGCCWNCDGC